MTAQSAERAWPVTSTSPEQQHDGAFPRGNAHLLDGVTGADHRVGIVPDQTGLRLLPADPLAAGPQCPLLWRWDRIYRPDSSGEDDVFSLLDAQDARLVPDDPTLARAIRSRATGDPRQAGAQFLGLKRRPGAAMAIGATVAALALVLLALAPLSGVAAHLLPADTGAATSDAAIDRLASAHPRCDGTRGMKALTSLSARLAASGGIDAPVLTVMDWDLVNAFALPGGRIVLTSGLLKDSEDGSEIAAVLAHEISHIVHRDPMTGWIRREGVSLVLTLVFGNEAAGSAVTSMTGALLNASYTRAQEDRADHTALELMRDNDISSEGGRAFFERLQKKEPGGNVGSLMSVISDHPGSADRAALFGAAQTGSLPGLDGAEFAAAKAMCD